MTVIFKPRFSLELPNTQQESRDLTHCFGLLPTKEPNRVCISLLLASAQLVKVLLSVPTILKVRTLVRTWCIQSQMLSTVKAVLSRN